MCAIGFLSFFSTPTLLTWLLFSWLIPLLFLSYSSYVAPRPHLIRSFSPVLPFPLVPFFLCTFTILPPQREHKHNVLGACKASGSQAHTSRRPICLLRQSLYTQCTCDCLLELLYKLLANGESELCCTSKNLISVGLFCLQDRVGEERNITSSTVWADKMVKIFKGNEG